jgi:hypothetical protein
MKTSLESLNPRVLSGAPQFPAATSLALLAAVLLLAPVQALALPSFARQINQQCTACHTEFPVLNQFGRNFKLTGYTAQDENASAIPLAFMLQPSWTHTATDQAGGAAPGFKPNDNFALSQASIFYAGRLVGPFGPKDPEAFINKIGVFMQTTYDGIAKTWALDNTEFRYATPVTVGGKDSYFGIYLNNNPTMQDLWQTTPAWGYPFSGSGLAPGPAAGLQIDGALGGQVYGLGTYLWWNDLLYVDVAAYKNLAGSFQKQVGIDPTGQTPVVGWAPYWRVAIQRMVGDARWEFGAYGLSTSTYPGGDSSEGKDKVTDVGIDSEYQVELGGKHDVTALVSYESEHQNWSASSALGGTTNGSDNLHAFKATVNYLYDKTYGLTAQYFTLSGSGDELLYSGSATGSPASAGYVLQASYLPLNKNGGPAQWNRSNVKFSLQYTAYSRFDGARSNYDGNGANAKDNNTLYFEAWIMF